MKKKKKVDTQAIDKVKLQSMISGGSGKSENDSIVLLDTDEEEGNAVSRPVTSVSTLSFFQVLTIGSSHLTLFHSASRLYR